MAVQERSTAPTEVRAFATALTTITCRWEITIVIVVQSLALYVFGERAGGGAVTVPEAVGCGLFGLFAQGLCSVLNDITDVAADRVNHPERPFPSGRVPIRHGWYVVGGCLAGAVLCAALLATTPFGAAAFAAHLALSVLYSAPGVRWGRHWLRGPLTLVASTVCGILAVLSCTALYAEPGAGRDAVLLVGVVCFLHHLLVSPLKDLRDVSGDAADGGSSLAMRLPRAGILALGVTGYLAPWAVLFAGARWIGGDLATPLSALAALLGAGGAVLAWLVVRRPALLEGQRFCWFAELGLLFLFQFSLPAAALV
ncbi:UbiA family prenyltransferase [Streptomyces radicis]|uniref:Prenyltransferase n=1 Tax=Streptomyces radicis TaxID=1750517 RepID=A0A3A9WAB5_9ACTN|nr:UbiA family prenyltransferase [Streptomyces radicis]RKN06324.1 hypothetical protein D7319_22795 [Streptomyces radicis]RKN18654.1 hypothetical protein D7318_21655 [Streptomyces radicis]